MNKLLLIFFISYFQFLSLFSQSCNPNFYLQKDIDNFHTNYPGCITIEGDLNINYGILNLDGLLGIKTIKGNIKIENADKLESLHGLDSIIEIGNGDYISIIIDKCYKLKSLKGLDNIQTKKYDLKLFSNVDLIDLNGLPKIDSFLGTFRLINSPDIHQLSGIETYKYIFLVDINNVGIFDCTGLEN